MLLVGCMVSVTIAFAMSGMTLFPHTEVIGVCRVLFLFIEHYHSSVALDK